MSLVTMVITSGLHLAFALFQLSNHQFEELAMDVYDEVDRRETDAGESSLYIFYPPLPYLRRVHLPLCVISDLPTSRVAASPLSVAGHPEPQHPGVRRHRGALPPRQPRVLLHPEPGKHRHRPLRSRAGLL